MVVDWRSDLRLIEFGHITSWALEGGYDIEVGPAGQSLESSIVASISGVELVAVELYSGKGDSGREVAIVVGGIVDEVERVAGVCAKSSSRSCIKLEDGRVEGAAVHVAASNVSGVADVEL